MEECKKCGQKDISVKFRHEGDEVYWSEHKSIEDIEKFTRNDRYYYSDKINKPCLVFKCKTCGFQKATETKDNQ